MLNASRSALVLTAFFLAHHGFAAEISEASLRAADAEQMRIIVDGDAKAQDAFMHPNYIINGPSNRVLRKAAVVDLLGRHPQPTEAEIRLGLAGNLCRCTGYMRIFEAVVRATAARQLE